MTSDQVFLDVFQTYLKDENGFLQYSFDIGESRFLCLDTKKDEPVSGQYCEKRMNWLDNELSMTSKDVYIFMHHLLLKSAFLSWTASILMKLKHLGI